MILTQVSTTTTSTWCHTVGCRYACQPREVVLDCGPYRDRSGLSSSLHSELNQALHFLNDCNLAGLRADRDPTFISKQVGHCKGRGHR